MDYLLIFAIGCMVGYLCYHHFMPQSIDKAVIDNILAGSRVIISIDDKSVIYELVGNKVTMREGRTEYTPFEDTDEKI